MSKTFLSFDEAPSNFCCGLKEIGEFFLSGKNSDYGDKIYENHDLAHFATTVPSQRGAIQRLEKAGFKTVAKWTRRNKKQITLWLRTPHKEMKMGAIDL